MLSSGLGVVRFSQGHSWTRTGGGARSVLVRADDPEAIARARAQLQLPDGIEPGVAALEDAVQIVGADPLSGPLGFGTAAPRVASGDDALLGAVTADRRIHLQRVDAASDPQLSQILTELGARTGVAAVALWPLREPGAPLVSHPRGAHELWRRTAIAGLQLGSRWAEAAP